MGVEPEMTKLSCHRSENIFRLVVRVDLSGNGNFSALLVKKSSERKLVLTTPKYLKKYSLSEGLRNCDFLEVRFRLTLSFEKFEDHNFNNAKSKFR